MGFSKRHKIKTIFPHKESRIFKYFEWGKGAFIEALKDRLKQDKDALILITGDTGSGKSHFTGNLCLKYFAKEDNFITGEGKMFDKDNFIIDPEEFAVKMISKSGCVLWIDEARRAVNRREWYNKINKIVVNRKNTNRKLMNIYFLLMPYETEIDPSFANHLCLWIWIRRGVGEVYCKTSGKKGGNGLDIQKILDREEKWLKENPKATFVIPTIHPEFLGRIYFNKLTPGLEREYNDLVKEKQAVGELTEEEKLQYGIIEKKSTESLINESIDNIRAGKITNKRDLWNHLKKETGLDDTKLEKKLNFYLKLEGLGTFSRLFDISKTKQLDIKW